MPDKIQEVDDVNTRAFHGTDIDSGNAIMREGFKYSNCVEPLLGDGVYFFDGQHRKAAIWAKRHIKERKLRARPCVMQSTVKYGRFLDLVDQDEHEDLALFFQEACRKAMVNVSLAQAIDYAAELLGIQVIRAIRRTGWAKPVTVWTEEVQTGFTTDDEIILCVRETGNILCSKICWTG